MKNEGTHKKIRNIAGDIEYLLSSHKAKVSEKSAILFCLMLSQNKKTQQLMVQAIISTYFNFLYSKNKKTYSDDFKKAVEPVLLNAFTQSYDKEQAKKHILGYFTSINALEEVYKIRENFVLNGFATKTIDQNDTPKIFNFVKQCMTLRESFSEIPDYQSNTTDNVVTLAILNALMYHDEYDSETKSAQLFQGVLIFIFLLLLEAYLLLSKYFSTDEYENKLVAPIFLSSILIDTIAISLILKTTKYINDLAEKRAAIAEQDAPKTLANKIPKLITITVKNKTTGQISLAYSLPLFNNTAPISAPLEQSPESQAAPSNPKHHKPKTRSPFFMGLFKPSTEPKSEHRQNNDTFNINGVNYHRLYNQDKKQTQIFIGYTKENLKQFATPQNEKTFKKLMQYPCVVPPKGSQGFVLMKDKVEGEALLPFKLKTSGNERLLFSHESDATLNNENIKLYQLSGSVTHNQASRLRKKL